MPRNTREWARRKLEAVSNLEDNIITHLLEVANTYAEQQPEIATNLIVLLEATELTKKSILDLRESF